MLRAIRDRVRLLICLALVTTTGVAQADRLVDTREVTRGDYLSPQFSPDGRDLLVTGPQMKGLSVATLAGRVDQLTTEPEAGVHARWLGDGAIAYRANPLTYRMGRVLVKIPYLGIANILLQEPMYPEFIQDAATPAALAAELVDCRMNRERIARTRRLAGDLRNLLTRPREGDAAHWLADELAKAGRAG